MNDDSFSKHLYELLTQVIPGLVRNAGNQNRSALCRHLAADDAEGQGRIAAFLQGLQEWGWTDGSAK